MNDSALHGDFAQRVVVDSAAMEWDKSPAPGVWRKRLELQGPPEAGRVTSLVRYDPGSKFSAHPHPDGEEFLVLEGTFSDQSGDYGVGSYLLNPEGFSHAPFTEEGCLIFVKLRQYPGQERPRVIVDSTDAAWIPAGDGVSRLTLFDEATYDDRMWLTRMDAGSTVPHHVHIGGEEIYVVEGTISDDLGQYAAGTWLRMPDGSEHMLSAETDALIYVKRGHLPSAHG